MDQSQLLELARQTVTYMTPLIVGGALAKVGEDTLDGAQTLAQRTWGVLRRAFQQNEGAEAALTLYKLKPDDPGRAQIVEGEVVAVLEQQPQLISELQELVSAAHQLGLLAPQDKRKHSVTISDNASAGVVVAGDLQGGIHVGTLSQDRVQGDKVMGNKVVNYGAPRPADTNPDHLRRLIDINTRRLRVLEEQSKRFGYSVPPHIETEIEDIRADIARLEALLKG